MTSGIAGLLQRLTRSSLIPWTKLVLLTNFRLIIVPGTKIQKVTTMASLGTKKVTASHGRTETTGRGKIKIKSHGKTIIKTRVISPVTLAFTLAQDQKFFVPADCDENTFQTICTLVKAPNQQGKAVQRQLKRS